MCLDDSLDPQSVRWAAGRSSCSSAPTWRRLLALAGLLLHHLCTRTCWRYEQAQAVHAECRRVCMPARLRLAVAVAMQLVIGDDGQLLRSPAAWGAVRETMRSRDRIRRFVSLLLLCSVQPAHMTLWLLILACPLWLCPPCDCRASWCGKHALTSTPATTNMCKRPCSSWRKESARSQAATPSPPRTLSHGQAGRRWVQPVHGVASVCACPVMSVLPLAPPSAPQQLPLPAVAWAAGKGVPRRFLQLQGL